MDIWREPINDTVNYMIRMDISTLSDRLFGSAINRVQCSPIRARDTANITQLQNNEETRDKIVRSIWTISETERKRDSFSSYNSRLKYPFNCEHRRFRVSKRSQRNCSKFRNNWLRGCKYSDDLIGHDITQGSRRGPRSNHCLLLLRFFCWSHHTILHFRLCIRGVDTNPRSLCFTFDSLFLSSNLLTGGVL